MWRRTAGHTVLITGFTPECVQQVLSTVKAMSHWHESGHRRRRRRRRGAPCVALTLPAWFGVLSVCNLSSSVRFPICRLKQSEISEACRLLSEWNVMVQGWSVHYSAQKMMLDVIDEAVKLLPVWGTKWHTFSINSIYEQAAGITTLNVNQWPSASVPLTRHGNSVRHGHSFPGVETIWIS